MGKKLKLFGLAVLGILFAIVYPKVKVKYDKYLKPHMHIVGKVYTTAKEFNVLGYHIPWRYILPVFALFVLYKLYKRRKRKQEEERLRRTQRYMTEDEVPAKTTTTSTVESTIEKKEAPAPPASAPTAAAPIVAPVITPTTTETTAKQPTSPNDKTSVSNRVKTFNFWPATSSANVFDLARAGFVFTGRDDVVECFYCKGTLKQWKVDDKAIQAHREFYPDCEFIKGVGSDSDVLTRLHNLHDVNQGVSNRLKQLQTVQEKSKQVDQANKHLSELQKRLDTTERTMHLVMKQMEAVTKCLAKTLADDPALSGDQSLAEITEGLVNLKESNV